MVNRALLEGLLGGLRYPATPRELADELRDLGDDGAAVAMLARLRRTRYASANDVCEELFPVEPDGAAPGVRASGSRIAPPPGGDRYTATTIQRQERLARAEPGRRWR